MHSNIFDKLSFWSLFSVIVLLPVFCLPFTNIPIETSKGFLLVLGLVLCLVFWTLARFSDGRITFPKSWLFVSGLGIILAFLISSLFSSNSYVSLFGTMLDVGSFYFILLGFVLMLMSSVIFRDQIKAKIVLLGIILSSAFVLIFQFAHIFVPKILALGILSDKTSNVLGSWNALGFFSGFACLMFLFVIEFFPISQKRKIVLAIFTLFALLLMVFVNFSLIWVFVGISSLIIFVYKISTTFHAKEEGEKKHFPIVSFVVVIVSLLFFVSGPILGGIIPSRFQISNTEISPTLGTTMAITKNVLMKNPIVGIGPNRFGEAWAMYKPVAINNTQFWSVSFDSGSGLLPTLTATTGILGILSWLVFLLLLLVIGTRSAFSSIKNGTNSEMTTFFLLSVYLFVSAFFYATGTVMFLLALAFAGIFIGLYSMNLNKEISFSFFEDRRKSFFTILLLLVVVILSVAVSFKYVERFISVSYFGKALSAQTESAAEAYINKAISLYSNDLYLRTYSQIYLIKLNSLAGKTTDLSDAEKADLQTSFDMAVNGAQMAAGYNPSSYLNFQLLGSVLQSVGSLGVKDANGKAIVAYQKASSLNPSNPGLKLAIATLSFAEGKIQDAKDYANAAISLKPDYIDAFLTLSQISKSEGDNAKALSYAKTALSFSPADKNLIQYVDSFNQAAPAPVAPTPAPNKSKN